MLYAHEYLRLKGLIFDLVILNDNAPGYMQSLQDELTRIVRTSGESNLLDVNGGIFLRRTDQIPEADREAAVIMSVNRARLPSTVHTMDRSEAIE